MDLSSKWLKRFTFYLLVALITYWFYDLIESFYMPIFWAAVLAIVFKPLHENLLRIIPNKQNLVATLTTAIISISVLFPTFFIVLAVIGQADSVLEQFRSGEIDIMIGINWVESKLPQLKEFFAAYNIDFADMRERFISYISEVGTWGANNVVRVGQDIVGLTANFFLMLYLLWFFVRDGEEVVNLAVRAFPIDNKIENRLLNKFAVVSRATLKGTLIVAAVQGALGGLLFAFIGIEGAIFWGVMMMLFSLLPVGGAAIVWVPTAIGYAIQGVWWKAIVIVVIGSLLIGTIDNFLRPMLVGRETSMPDYLILIATLGGVASFGLSGFVLGPVLASLFLSVWEVMMLEFNVEEVVVEDSNSVQLFDSIPIIDEINGNEEE